MLDLILHIWELLCKHPAVIKPSMDTIKIAFQNTTSGDPLRRLFVDICVRSQNLEPFNSEAGDRIAEFFFELAKAAMGGITGDQKAVIVEGRQTCKYHQHDEKPCYRVVPT